MEDAFLDRLTPKQRSMNMSRIRGKDTKPELFVRRVTYSLGYRYRLHGRDLPGTPDLVFRGRRKAIFVHGCFWHGHGCGRSHKPRTRSEYWSAKLSRNRARDKRQLDSLKKLGWSAIVIWECETTDRDLVAARISEFLGS